MRRVTFIASLLSPVFGAACDREAEPDAYGNVETTEVVIGAEASGQLLWFTPRDGGQLGVGAVVGLIDTTQLALEREQIVAQRAASRSRTNEITQQLGALQVQREIAQRAYERTRRLYDQQAATAQQLDQTEREYRVLGEQIEAARAQRQTVVEDVSATEAGVALISERIRKSQVRNPLAGTVLATYAEAGEFVQPGQPLYRIANLDSMIVRVYVTEPQLAQLRIGQPAQVSVDVREEERRTLSGTVIWVSPQAEFTPTPIQTREERADLVYAIKVHVPNESGLLKIGMPVDVQFATTTAAR